MAADDPPIVDLAGAILDGDPLDWDSAESSATEATRAILSELRAIAAISSLHRGRGTALPGLASLPLSSWGPLRVFETIGRGGFGAVFRAWDPQLDRDVALKLLPAGQDVIGALEEGRLLAKVHHPNVVTIYGADRIGTHVGLWMELIRGDTLEDVLAREGPLAPDRVAAIGRQLCEALEAVHAAGLVHRDVKARNVMVQPDGRLVLMDFGAGRFLAVTEVPHVAGTPLYLAPEVFQEQHATPQSDLYSVGVLLFHLLTGRYPLEGRTLQELRDAHAARKPPNALGSLRPDVPGRLTRTIEQALRVEPDQRFASASALRNALAPAEATGRHIPRLVTASCAAVALVALVATMTTSAGRQWLASFARFPSQAAPAFLTSDTPTTRRLSLPEGYLFGSGLSYDGRFFAYSDSDANLAVFEMSTGKTEVIVRAHDGQFAQFAIMSPAGEYVAYQWWTGEDRRTYELRIVDRVTKADRVLMSGDGSLDVPFPIEWSRDGTQILLWASTPRRVGRIALVGVAAGDVKIVRELRGSAPLGMSLSGDARYVAYDLPTSAGASSRSLRVVGTDGNGDRALLPQMETSDRFPLWTPDGQHVFFLSDRSGSSDGWLVPVVDGAATDNPRVVVRNLSRVSSLGINEAGSFYYRLQSGAFDVEEVELDPTTMTPVSKPQRVATQLSGSSIGPGYSPDGRLLSYILVRQGLGVQGTNSIVIRDLAGGTEREVNPPLDLGLAPPKWSPDGRRLLVRGLDDSGSRGARVINAKTGMLEASVFSFLDKDETDYGSMAWAPDGQAVLYDHEPRGIVRHPLDGGPEEIVLEYSAALPIKRIHRFAVSPGGSQIALSGWSPDGSTSLLLVKDVSGFRELARRTRPELAVVQAWSPDGQFVAFTTLRFDRPPPHELWRAPAAGGAAARMGLSIPGGTQVNPMAFSPTGSALAYTAGSPLQELWMMENFLPK